MLLKYGKTSYHVSNPFFVYIRFTIAFVLVCPNKHASMDTHPAYGTLFLHEDLLARTLAFEIELRRWRCAEIEAGRDDPGRPAYENVFQVSDYCMIHSAHVERHHSLAEWHHRTPLALRQWRWPHSQTSHSLSTDGLSWRLSIIWQSFPCYADSAFHSIFTPPHYPSPEFHGTAERISMWFASYGAQDNKPMVMGPAPHSS